MLEGRYARRARDEEGDMARTPLLGRIQETLSAIREARERNVDVEQVLEERALTRRELLKRAGVAGAAVAGAATFGRIAGRAYGAQQPRIAIVGAGLAGLTCAYRLQQAGLYAQVYEAHASRVGGRCWRYSPLRNQNPFPDG